MSAKVIIIEYISLRINKIILNYREIKGRSVSFVIDPSQ